MTKNKEKIEVILDQAYSLLSEAIDLSLQDISKSPDIEKDYIAFWAEYAAKINSYFVKKAEKTGNEQVGKNLIKYFMFNR
ncbi:MAG: hypothetical protein VB106_10135 [Clostridiaceae bacterium]|jgi:hypothetical protein|nr:hypothetical protein [Clostridiaceae bacterium]